VRRTIHPSPDLAYYLVFAPVDTPLNLIVQAIGARWHIEEDLQTAKDLGLDHCAPRCTITASSGKRATHNRK
jgi:SRSO17 transposase